LVGASIFNFIPELRAGDNADQQQTFERISESLLECKARTMAKDEFPVELSISRVRLRDEVLYTAIVRDISDRKAQQRQLQFQATHDPLTTLPNRPALAAHLDGRLAGCGADGCVALLMIDLDRFKEVNDTLGHNVGDHVLHEVARRLAEVATDRGFLARIGGDEFALVVDRFHDLAMISQLSQDLADCLKQPIEASGIAIEVGLSIGIARFPDDARDAESLFKYADVAMYSAKRASADFEYYDTAKDRHTVRKLTILSQLRRAITANKLELHYQPQVNLNTRCVDGVEALLRWHDQTLGAVRPDEFIELAEATDLIQPLSNWTIQQALQQSAAWKSDGLDLRVAINISARVLQDVGFPARLSELMSKVGVNAGQIELEITESAIMIDPQRALQVTQRLSDLGFLVSVDDYGTGYSSLAYLRDLPVHALKLDKSFVLNMQQRSENRVIVESTVQMAHALNLKVVAEGVETSADAKILSDCGYDYAQGFLYSPALPASALANWVRDYDATNDVAQAQNHFTVRTSATR
jgi:diguanylate cyclase (GGDEF)-like protein